MKKVLFLCTGNSARSIISECLMNQMGEGKYRAHSAGSKPTGTVNPFSIQVLKKIISITRIHYSSIIPFVLSQFLGAITTLIVLKRIYKI